MRVLWLSHRPGLAGAERSLVEGVRALANRGHTSVVALPWEGPLRGPCEEAGAAVRVARNPRWGALDWRSAAGMGPAVVGMARLVRECGADVVVTNTLTAPTGALAAALARRPHVWFAHELPSLLDFALGERRSLALMSRLSAVVLANSATVRDALSASVDASRLRVVNYAVETPLLPAAADPADPPRLVLVGTLTPQKGQDEAIRALAQAVLAGIDAELRLVGPPLNRHDAALERLAVELGIRERVVLTGFIDDPRSEVAAADVALVCARGEAFGRATVEAMKLGTAVIGADEGGTSELVAHGETGLLYPPGDVEALAARIVLLVRDDGLRASLARRARTWASETFTLERYGAELESALRDALATRH